MKRVLFAGLLLAGASTAALAADPAAGEKVFKAQCGICHSAVQGKNGIGPSLFGVIGRQAGTAPGFHFTADHKKLGVTWDTATMDKYLANPRAMVKDTSMTYAGLKEADKRADVVAYLATLH